MKAIWCLLFALIFALGCARIMVETPKEPIKVDITMRLDIYQHIQKDITAIEDIVSGPQEKNLPQDKKSLLDYFISCAYAQEGLGPEIEQAALRRRDRHPQIASQQEKGIIGESRLGLLEIKDPRKVEPSIEQLLKAENQDRLIIYRAIAKRNNAPLQEVQAIYAQRLQENAPCGTPIEVFDTDSGNYAWKTK